MDFVWAHSFKLPVVVDPKIIIFKVIARMCIGLGINLNHYFLFFLFCFIQFDFFGTIYNAAPILA